MPTNREKRTRKRRAPVETWKKTYMLTGEFDDVDVLDQLYWNDALIRETWKQCRDALLDAWIIKHPGTRPYAWWLYDAPGTRLRVGGKGTASGHALAADDTHCRGIPRYWLTQEDIDFYQNFDDTPFNYVAYDEGDPPTYESEPAYLDRLGLLADGERKQLKPENFKQEIAKNE